MSKYNLYLNDIMRAIKKIEDSVIEKDEDSFLKGYKIVKIESPCAIGCVETFVDEFKIILKIKDGIGTWKKIE